MKRRTFRVRLTILILLLIGIAAILGGMSASSGATEIKLLNSTDKSVRFKVWEASSDWVKSGVIPPSKSVHFTMIPKRAGVIRFAIMGDEINFKDQLYIERASVEVFDGVIDINKIVWK